MAFQYSQAVQDAQLDAFTNTVGASPKLQVFSGAKPAAAANAATGTKLVEIQLPASWMNPAANNLIDKVGAWSAAATAAGTAGYFRIVDGGGVCHLQGSVSAAGGGGDMIVDNTNVAVNQTVTVTAFSMARGNS